MIPQGGYFHTGRENDFPWWSTDRATWYFTIGNLGQICGYTPSKTNKKLLIESLKADPELALFGVWTGKYNTSIFVLESQIAIVKLQEVL